MQIQDALSRILDGQGLNESEAEAVFDLVLAGETDEAQIASLLSLLQAKGVSSDELTGAARSMRTHVTRVPTPAGVEVLDTCGTGGAPKTFNVSTAAAVVAAAAAEGSFVVAKHGNRSRTGRGSAEVLAELGVHLDASPEVQGRCLAEAGLCFCFAIRHHPATKHAVGPRRSLAFPTIFNVLGPLTNPAGASRQLIGVYDESLVGLVAETLRRLGATRAMVAHSTDGLDELTVTAPTILARVERGEVSRHTIDPHDVGLPNCSIEDVRASDLDDAAGLIRRILAGETGPHRDMVLVNAAAALHVGGACGTLSDGVPRAAEAIDSGAAARTLETLARVSHTDG